jgi:hypothetical protein
VTQSPMGGTASPGVQPSATHTNDFGATTMSGTPNATTSAGMTATGTRRQAAGPVDAQRQPQPAAGGARNRGPRRARLQLRHISPLTVLKFSCVLAIALFFVWLIVVGVLYGVLDAASVVTNVNKTIVQLNGPGSKAPITAGIVFGGAAIIGVVNIVLFVALATIGSVVYNLCADLVGGIEITLSER